MTTTIKTPTATEISPGTFAISVEATLMDGAVEVGKNTFTTTISSTNTVARNEVAISLANQITAWKSSVERIAGFTTVLTNLKTNIEGRL